MYTNTPSTERNEKPRRGERRGSVGERPRMFIAALPRPSEISARQSHHLSPEGFEPIRRQLGVAHRVLDVEEAFVCCPKVTSRNSDRGHGNRIPRPRIGLLPRLRGGRAFRKKDSAPRQPGDCARA